MEAGHSKPSYRHLYVQLLNRLPKLRLKLSPNRTKSNNYCSPLLNTSYRPTETLVVKASVMSFFRNYEGRNSHFSQKTAVSEVHDRHCLAGADGFSLDGETPFEWKDTKFFTFIPDGLDCYSNTAQAACIISQTSGLEPPSASFSFNSFLVWKGIRRAWEMLDQHCRLMSHHIQLLQRLWTVRLTVYAHLYMMFLSKW